MLNKLYNGFASYYAVITNDRDFKDQVDCILDTFGNQPTTILELFAGQATHSIEASTRGIDIWAIDSSSEMKQLAIDDGFKNPDQYFVGNLPEAVLDLSSEVKFDCILILFNGICNLDTTDLHKLLQNIMGVLNTNGKVFIEIQDLFYMMEYVSNASINYQNVIHPNGDLIKYAWPGDKIKWDPYTLTAEVPVRMIIESSGDSYENDFISIDHIHSTEVVLFIAGLLGFKGKILTEDEPFKKHFSYQVLLELTF